MRKIDKTLEGVSSVLLIILTMVVTIQIFSRVLSISVPWSEELARQVLIAFSFLGGALAYYKSGELKITMLIDVFPETLRKWNDFIISILSIVISLIVLYSGILFLSDIWGTPTVALRWNKGIFFLAIPISFLLIFIKLTRNLFGIMKPKEIQR
ncbi:TRAP transporter small permease subunit [Sporosarcina sp. FSL K6-3508]|uniref:TRAP transporter small permease n=1 Tax=Sporosarcina sp. FSL K6-3508 TaxID=2921557 RepID=UPI00315A6C52